MTPAKRRELNAPWFWVLDVRLLVSDSNSNLKSS